MLGLLLLLCVCVSAAPGGKVLVSSLVHEELFYVARAVENLVAFTAPVTPIVVHLSAGREALARAPAEIRFDRVFWNPKRFRTGHARGTILAAHLSNAAHGAALGLPFEYVLYAASTDRLFLPGVERFVVEGRFSKIGQAAWLRGACAEGGRQSWFFRAVALNGTCRAGFSQHEGMFYPRSAGERFAAFAASTKVTAELHDQAQKRVVAATNGTLAEAIEAVVDGTGGWGAEEVFLQSFVLNRMRDELAAARPPKFAPSAEVHWTTRGQFVGARDVVAYRLGRNASLVLAPYMMKRWRPDPLKNRTADDRFLECLGARDAAARTSPSELALVDDRALQRNTLACVDALAVDLGGAEPSHPLAPQQAARSLFPGAENPYPDLVALRDKVRRWVDG